MPDIKELVRAEGFLYKNPTSLTDPTGYGTCLGYTISGVDVYTNDEIEYRVNEENGNNIWRKFHLGNRPKVLSMLRNYNADVISVVGQGHNIGSKLSISSGYSIGEDITNQTCSLAFIPKNVAYPCVYVKYASAKIYGGSSISFGHSNYTVFPLEVECLSLKLFGDVKVVSSYAKAFGSRLRYPSALIVVSGFLSDSEHPGIGEQSFSVISLVSNKTDVYGENLYTGSGESTGLHQVSRKVLEAITEIQSISGSINIQEGASGGTKFNSPNNTIVYREFKCSVLLEGV